MGNVAAPEAYIIYLMYDIESRNTICCVAWIKTIYLKIKFVVDCNN